MCVEQKKSPGNALGGKPLASRRGYIGTVKVDGDPGFDCNSVVNTDSNQWRWLSYPESRMVVNPGDRPGYDGGMNLNLGLFVSGVQNAANLQKIQMGAAGETAKDCDSVSTAWYPYKLTAHAVYGRAAVDMTEFFVDKNTFVRLADVKSAVGQTMTMSAHIDGLSVLNDGSMLVTKNDYYLVYKIMLLSSNGSVDKIITPTVNSSGWKAEISFTEALETVAFSLTLSARADNTTAATVINRAAVAVSGKLPDKLAATKAFWDGKLARVPMPTVWGIRGGLEPKEVTEAQHRRTFYAAWAFNYQNILEPTPETGYMYYQITLGKASLWGNGSPESPNSCVWESMFDIQQMALLEPDIAWNAVEGFIRSIDDNGILKGECLPSQKAHSVWVCYANKKDDAKLAALYPKIKKYLQWRAENPRWIFGDHDYADEKDISFVAQWYSDLLYVIKIGEVLGEHEDIDMWNRLKEKMGNNARAWFFTPAEGDPTDKVYNTCFADSGAHYSSARPTDVENYINAALRADLPEDLTEKLVRHYITFQNPAKDLVGFDFYKYGDGCQIAYGLLEKGRADPRLAGMWQEFTNAAVRRVIKTGEFCEEARPDVSATAGVTPSSFGSSTIIDFTYLNNGMRIDLGAPAVI